MPSLDRIADSTKVYRTLTKARQIGKDGRPLLPAFYRERKDDDGISVDYNVPDATPEFCGAGLKGHRAILSVEVGAVRALAYGLDVIPDTEHHAVIDSNVPYCDDAEQFERVQQIAADLVQIAGDPVWPKSAN